MKNALIQILSGVFLLIAPALITEYISSGNNGGLQDTLVSSGGIPEISSAIRYIGYALRILGAVTFILGTYSLSKAMINGDTGFSSASYNAGYEDEGALPAPAWTPTITEKTAETNIESQPAPIQDQAGFEPNSPALRALPD